MRPALTFPYRLALLACSVLVGLNLLPDAFAVFLTAAVVGVVALRLGLVPTLVAVAVLGLPFLHALASLIGLTPTVLVMGLDVILLVLVSAASPALLSLPAYKGVRRFLVWWFVFLAIYSIFSFTAELSDYSIFTWQYLAVYGSYYALAGVLAVRHEITPSEAMAVGLPLFAFNYPLLHASIISVSTIADATIGLRGSGAFDPITGARAAGLLLLMALAVICAGRRNQRWVPEIVVAIVCGAPLAWYAYTRQVYVAAALVALWMLAAMVFGPRVQGESLGRRLATLAVMCLLATLAVSYALQLLGSNMHSRIAEHGLQSDRADLWLTSLRLIASSPISGIGIGEFQRAGYGLWPHNWIIEAWLALGLPGLILTAIGAGVVVAALFRRSERWLSGWLFLALYYLLVAQVSADIARNAPLLFFIVLAFHATCGPAHRAGLSQRKGHSRLMRLGSFQPGTLRW